MRKFLILPALALCACCSVALAQLDRASLSGTISDTSGAVVPEVRVEALQVETNVTFSATTNSSGVFNFLALPIGEYTVSSKKAGFSTAVRPHVMLTAASAVRVDLTLAPGSIEQVVSVVAQAPLLEERSSAYGTDVQVQTLDELPLQMNGGQRSVYDYLNAIPGVSNNGFSNNILGGLGMYSQVLVDGIGAEYNPGVGGVMDDPPSPETMGEFKVVNTMSAEYGLTGGSFMSFVTKSGTNSFHGDAFEFLRNDAFDARSFFASTVSTEKQHEFGVTAGGPVVLPKLYDGRNKTFFFGSYTRYMRHNVNQGQVLTLPTDAFRSGDFSALLGNVVGTDTAGRAVQDGAIYDPSSTRSDGHGGYLRDVFPGNRIPDSRQSVVTKKWQSYLPSVPNAQAIANNYVGSSGLVVRTRNLYFAKGDQVIGSKDQINGSFKGEWDFKSGGCVLPTQYCGGDTRSHPYSLRAAYTHTFSPRVVGQVNYGLDRTAGPGWTPTKESGTLNDTIGLKGAFSPAAPWLDIQGGYPGDGLFGNHTTTQLENNANSKVTGSIGWFHGTHSMKFGGNYYRWNANFMNDNLGNGHFVFTSGQTSLPGASQSETGFGYASFLLGAPNYVEFKAPEEHGERSWALGIFAQDEWRASSRLTLTYGLRYDYQPQYTSPHYDGTEFDPLLANPGAGGLPGALTFLGFGDGRSGRIRFSDTYPWGFGPRFGFAYKLTAKAAVRGSYGLFNAPVSQFSGEIANRAGFVPRFTSSSQDGISPAFYWDNGLPLNFNPKPQIGPTISNGSGTTFVGKNNAHPAQVQMVNFSLQYELPRSVLFEAAYIGNFSHHVASNSLEQINQLDYSKYGHLGQLLIAPIDSPEAVAAGIQSPYPGFSGTVAQALRPFPQYMGINGTTSMLGNSVYHAMQLKLQKRYASGLSFLIGYTVSKNLNDVDDTVGYFSSAVQDAYNRRAEKAVSSIDSPQELVASYTYQVPFGKGKSFLNGNNWFTRNVIGGWSISGIHKYRRGTPLSIVTGTVLPTTNDSLSNSSMPVRPNMVPGVSPMSGISCSDIDPASQLYLNAGAFSTPAPYTFGNAARRLSTARTCPTLDENLSLMKYVPMKEGRVNLRIGVDAFHIFNRRNLGGPDTNISDPGFGTISGDQGLARVLQMHAKILW